MFDRDKHHRRTIRLKGWNYSNTEAYFITVCSRNREFLFGKILDGKMQLNEYGRIAETEWLQTAAVRSNVELDEYIIMPNHIHGILVIINNGRGVLQYAPTEERSFRSPTQTIGAIVRGFKSATTKHINIKRDTPRYPVWQRNYYEHIIRNENELNRIRQYIIENPIRWEEDPENPENIKLRGET